MYISRTRLILRSRKISVYQIILNLIYRMYMLYIKSVNYFQNIINIKFILDVFSMLSSSYTLESESGYKTVNFECSMLCQLPERERDKKKIEEKDIALSRSNQRKCISSLLTKSDLPRPDSDCKGLVAFQYHHVGKVPLKLCFASKIRMQSVYIILFFFFTLFHSTARATQVGGCESPRQALRNARDSRFIACERPTTCGESRALVQVAARRDTPSRSYTYTHTVPRRADVTRGYVLARAKAPRLVLSCLTSPCLAPSRLASSRLASRPCRVAHASNVFLRRARFFATAFLPPFPRAHACTYFFVNLIAPTRGFLLPRFFFARAPVYTVCVSRCRIFCRDRYYSEYFCSF